MKLIRPGAGLGRFILSPVAVIAMLALMTTAVALAAPPDKTHPPKDQPSASATVDEDESPEVDESESPDASGACNALHGNAPQVIQELVANWPTKHDKGDKTKDVPPGLQKVADRLLVCLGEDPNASPSPEASSDPNPSPSAIVVDDEGTVLHAGKAVGLGHAKH